MLVSASCVNSPCMRSSLLMPGQIISAAPMSSQLTSSLFSTRSSQGVHCFHNASANCWPSCPSLAVVPVACPSLAQAPTAGRSGAICWPWRQLPAVAGRRWPSDGSCMRTGGLAGASRPALYGAGPLSMTFMFESSRTYLVAGLVLSCTTSLV
jgi:hypothetical protein